jgi:hypothetical protein
MAFVQRTTRDNNRVGFAPNAGTNIGPGTYNLGTSIRSGKPSFAPFGGTAARPELGNGGGTFVTPGPGTYGSIHKQPFREMASSNAFRSRTKRFNKKVGVDTPGPGAYSGQSSFKISARKTHDGDESMANPPPVTWVRVTSAPSIPTKGQTYGYEEGKFGELVMQKGPQDGYSGKAGDVAGPGAYNASNKLTKTQLPADWARSRSKRTDFTKNGTGGQIPGPGAYSGPVGAGDYGNAGEFEPKGTSSFVSSSTRSKPTKHAKAPGPGAYVPKDQFRKPPVPESMQFFGSTSRRFQDRPSVKSAGPGPGSYDLRKSKRGASIPAAAAAYQLPTGVGFASTSSRFAALQNRDQTFNPAPGEYTQTSMAADLEKKLVSRTGVFGSTTKRFAHGMNSKGGGKSPGPGSYTISTSLGDHTESILGADGSIDGTLVGRIRRRVVNQSSSFASNSKRGAALKSSDVPPPGTYTVNSDWTAAALKKGGRTGVLGSGSERFNRKVSENGLGPGAYYNPNDSFAKVSENPSNVMVSTERRFKSNKALPVPGPGAYDTEFLYGNLNKRTFNMTIAEQEALS